jgi:hypothetical protein
MNPLRRAILSPRSLLVASLVFGLLPRSHAQGYFPQPNTPVDTNAALKFIESILHNEFTSTKTTATPGQSPQFDYSITVPSLLVPDSQDVPALPPLPGDDKTHNYPDINTGVHYKLATDAQLDVALGAAVQKVLDGTATTAGVPYAGTLADLVGALANYKKTTIPVFIKTATTNILNWSGTFPSAATQSEVLSAITAAACEADPSKAAAIVGAMMPLVVPKVAGGTTGNLGMADNVKYGAAQIVRLSDTAVDAAGLKSVLNAIPGVLSKGGIKVEANGANIDLTFGGTTQTVNPSTDTLAAIQGKLNLLGLQNYGQFTLAHETLTNIPINIQDDILISFKPIILNIAGGTKRDTTAVYADAADDVVRAAMSKAAVNGVAIVNAAMGVAIQGIDVSGGVGHSPVDNNTLAVAKSNAKKVAAAAVNAAFDNSAAYLADELAVAIGTKLKAASYFHKATAVVGVTKKPVVTSSDIVTAIFKEDTITTTNWSTAPIKDIALVAAGLMKGFHGSLFEGGSTGNFVDADQPEKNIVDALKDDTNGLGLTLGTSGKTYLDGVEAGFQTAYQAPLPTNALSVGQAVLGNLSTHGTEIAARLTGALAWLPTVVSSKDATLLTYSKGSFIANVLQINADTAGGETISTILETTTRASATTASTVANLAALWAKTATTGPNLQSNRYGQITKGVALGLKGQPLYTTMLTTTVTKVLTAAPLTKVPTTITTTPGNVTLKAPVKYTAFDTAGANELKELATYTISGAIGAGQSSSTSAVMLTLAKASSAFYRFYQPLLEGALAAGSDLPTDQQWRAILPVMAAKKLSTSIEFNGQFDETINSQHPKPTFYTDTLEHLIADYVKSRTGSVFEGAGLAGYDTANNLAVDNGATVIKNIQDHPKAVFNFAYQGFFTDPNVASSSQATLAALTSSSLVSASSVPIFAAIAIKARPADFGSIQTEALGLNPALAANTKISIATASHVANSTSDLFDYLDRTIYNNSKYLTDIVSAATVVVPGHTNIIAHVASLRAPAAVSKIVAPLFNYSHITSTDSTVPDPTNANYKNVVDATTAITAAITAGVVEAKTNLVTGTGTPTLKTATVEITNLKNAIVAVVKQTLNLTGNTPANSSFLPGSDAYLSAGFPNGDTSAGGGEGSNNFLQYNPGLGIPQTAALTFNGSMWVGSFSRTTQIGPAGVITGFMSQMISATDTRLPGRAPGSAVPGSLVADGDLGLVGQVLTAAIAVVKTDVSKILAIAQAAAQAAYGVQMSYGGTPVFANPASDSDHLSDGEKDIVRAILNTFIVKIAGVPTAIDDPLHTHPQSTNNMLLANNKPNPYYQLDVKLANAVHFGVMAAAANIPAAGAAGVINFAHHTLTGTPVTDIFGL